MFLDAQKTGAYNLRGGAGEEAHLRKREYPAHPKFIMTFLPSVLCVLKSSLCVHG